MKTSLFTLRLSFIPIFLLIGVMHLPAQGVSEGTVYACGTPFTMTMKYTASNQEQRDTTISLGYKANLPNGFNGFSLESPAPLIFPSPDGTYDLRFRWEHLATLGSTTGKGSYTFGHVTEHTEEESIMESFGLSVGLSAGAGIGGVKAKISTDFGFKDIATKSLLNTSSVTIKNEIGLGSNGETVIQIWRVITEAVTPEGVVVPFGTTAVQECHCNVDFNKPAYVRVYGQNLAIPKFTTSLSYQPPSLAPVQTSIAINDVGHDQVQVFADYTRNHQLEWQIEQEATKAYLDSYLDKGNHYATHYIWRPTSSNIRPIKRLMRAPFSDYFWRSIDANRYIYSKSGTGYETETTTYFTRHGASSTTSDVKHTSGTDLFNFVNQAQGNYFGGVTRNHGKTCYQGGHEDSGAGYESEFTTDIPCHPCAKGNCFLQARSVAEWYSFIKNVSRDFATLNSGGRPKSLAHHPPQKQDIKLSYSWGSISSSSTIDPLKKTITYTKGYKFSKTRVEEFAKSLGIEISIDKDFPGLFSISSSISSKIEKEDSHTLATSLKVEDTSKFMVEYEKKVVVRPWQLNLSVEVGGRPSSAIHQQNNVLIALDNGSQE